MLEGKAVSEKTAKKFHKEEALASTKKSQKEEALASIKFSEIYKWNKKAPISWPAVGMLREKSEETLKQLRVKKIEWAVADTDDVVSLRFTLNDGTTSNQIGTHTNVNKSIEFPEDKPIRSVRV